MIDYSEVGVITVITGCALIVFLWLWNGGK